MKISEDEINRNLALKKAEAETEIARLEGKFREAEITEKQFIEGRQAINKKLVEYEAQALVDRFTLIKGDNEKEKAILNERALLITKLEKLKLDQKKETDEFTQKSIQDEIDKTLELVEILERRAEVEKRIADEKQRQKAATDEEKNGGKGASEPGISGEEKTFGAIDDIFGLSDETVNKVTGKVEVLKGVFGGLAVSVKSAAAGMVSALGSAIEGYLLYGDSIGKALKQAAAAELAHIASVSAIKAIYQLAEGFASLFYNPAAASAHFQAAALYGAVAIGSGIAARALAGNQNQATNAFAQQSATGRNNPSTGGGGNSSGGGNNYSGNPTATVREEDRLYSDRTNAALSGRHDTLTLKIPRSMIGAEAVEEIRNYGPLRKVIIDLVND